MRPAPIRFVPLLGIGLLFVVPGSAATPGEKTNAITLTPQFVEAGSPELVCVSFPAADRVEGEWLGHKLTFFRTENPNRWYALAGVDVEAAAGQSTLAIRAHSADQAATTTRTVTVQIHPAHYKTGSLTVAPKFVEPGPDDRLLIAAATKAKEQAFATTAAKPLWSGSFAAPVHAAPTDSFGTRRMFNGKLASIHKGMDFRAGTGTPVLAGNAGKVVLAQALYYEGNCVMVDHGLGLMTISMHLSRIDVKPGQAVSKGQRLGLSGATGRVTGPHLHWAIRWDGAMLDPAKLLKLDLTAIH